MHSHAIDMFQYVCEYLYVVPTPDVTVTDPSTLMVGDSIVLHCNVTTVRGITSRVDIVWSSNGTVLERVNSTTATTMGNSSVYTDSYTISQLNTTDDGRVIQCEVVINTIPAVMTSDNVMLDVTSKCLILKQFHWKSKMYIIISWYRPIKAC